MIADTPRFRAADVGAIRTPAFPASIVRQLYEASDLRAALFALLASRRELVATIRLASEDLYVGITRWLERGVDRDD